MGIFRKNVRKTRKNLNGKKRVVLMIKHLIKKWAFKRNTRNQLERLSDHQLKDIGLNRNEISYRSKEAAERWFSLQS